MKGTYYALELENYSTPAFCSGFTRTYAGTKEQLADFMGALAQSRPAENFQPLLDAYRAWLRGEPAGVVERNYCACWNIRPLEVYGAVDVELPGFSTEHLNIWQCPYMFQADRVRARIVYARDGGSWRRFIRAAFQNLQMEGFRPGTFMPVGGRFWGHPAVLALADGVTSNRLLFQERELGGDAAMLRDAAAPAEIDFTGFMEDILGDG